MTTEEVNAISQLVPEGGGPGTGVDPGVGPVHRSASREDGGDPEHEALLADIGFTIAHGKIVAVDLLAEPERLSRLDLAILNA